MCGDAPVLSLDCDGSRIGYGYIKVAFEFDPPVPADVLVELEEASPVVSLAASTTGRTVRASEGLVFLEISVCTFPSEGHTRHEWKEVPEGRPGIHVHVTNVTALVGSWPLEFSFGAFRWQCICIATVVGSATCSRSVVSRPRASEGESGGLAPLRRGNVTRLLFPPGGVEGSGRGGEAFKHDR